ncbi:hypothetical protein AB205_0092730 [Aquarana catesbeiana]|uniref:Uncharacterized protein n=1 Tax=Aquarana catesbeiana TaxID=8400 RepID=A0A2G9RIC4_AQUCT|nr:hypothetical protein AB205_0092730 [Aquarana catesbeiana]
MVERQQVHENSSNDDESPEPETSRSRRRFKTSNMSFVEMVEMVDILKRADYDGKHGPYRNPYVGKAKIMTKVVRSLQRNFGVTGLELCQNRQLYNNSKQCFMVPYLASNICVLSIPFIFIHIGEKRIGTSEVTRNPTTPEEGEIPTHPEKDVEGGEVHELGEIVTATGDVDVVEEETHFNCASAQILIGEIMVCNRELEKVKENINDVEKRLNNIIDVLGRI